MAIAIFLSRNIVTLLGFLKKSDKYLVEEHFVLIGSSDGHGPLTPTTDFTTCLLCVQLHLNQPSLCLQNRSHKTVYDLVFKMSLTYASHYYHVISLTLSLGQSAMCVPCSFTNLDLV